MGITCGYRPLLHLCTDSYLCTQPCTRQRCRRKAWSQVDRQVMTAQMHNALGPLTITLAVIFKPIEPCERDRGEHKRRYG